ncbi:MAG: hypothetical protein NVS4B1_16250 [Ktedonobacteraceae bacterium]
MKYFKINIGVYELCAVTLIVLATLLRVTLAYQHWPLLNSDEGTMGIMALHIFSRGEHPIFFYGQNYMGATEAYLGAALFHVFGPSLFTLRLGLILLFIVFLISTYLVASILYTKAVGLGALLLLALGSIAVVSRQLAAIGGYAETITCGSLAFLLASWLALSSQGTDSAKQWQRVAAYGAWGLIVGLGIWSDLLVLPFVLCSALLLLFCWRELLQVKHGAVLCLLLGLSIGISPLIFYYSISSGSGQSVLTTILQLQGGQDIPHSWRMHIQEVKQTIQVALPTATGNPFCPFSEFPQVLLLGPSTLPNFQCTVINTSWGIGYLLLWFTSACLTFTALWKIWKSTTTLPHRSLAERRSIIRLTGQMLLLCSAGLAIALFVFSPSSLRSPSVHSRYLMGVLIATPALLAPLLLGSYSLKSRIQWMSVIIRGSLFLFLSILFFVGTLYALNEIPAAQAADRRENALIEKLIHIGATHIYTDYWTCDRLAFQSNERIICGVLDTHLHPAVNRDPRYYAIVSADPHAFYIFPDDVPQAASIRQKFTHCGKACRPVAFSGYVVYQPTRAYCQSVDCSL